MNVCDVCHVFIVFLNGGACNILQPISCNVSGNELYTFKLSHLFTERWSSPENNDPDGWLANFVTWIHEPYLVDPGFQNVPRKNGTQKNSLNEVP